MKSVVLFLKNVYINMKYFNFTGIQVELEAITVLCKYGTITVSICVKMNVGLSYSSLLSGKLVII